MSRIRFERILFVVVAMIVAGSVFAAEPPLNANDTKAQAMLERVRSLAEQGDPDAQYNMGVIYDRGYDVEQNYAKARAWYEKAAAQNYAKAAHNLGVMYQKGHGVPVDNKRALHWFRQAAKLGEPAAQNNLAVMYAEGLGVEQNFALAATWVARAARAGNDSAIANLPLIVAELPATMIAGDDVNIRSEPTADAGVMQQADSGTEVVLLREREQWTQVLLPSDYTVGWVASSLLGAGMPLVATVGADARPATSQAEATPAVVVSSNAGSATPAAVVRKAVGTGTLNVRKQPSRQAAVVFQLHRGEQVTVTKRHNGWTYVKADDGRRGWAAGYLLLDM